MAWDPDEDLSKKPLEPHERQQTRRVIRWFERRASFRASIARSAGWLVGLPTALAAGWALVQHFLTGK